MFEQFSIKGKQGIQTRTGNVWKKLNTTKTTKGYLQVALHRKPIRVNRLIAESFIENPNNFPEAHHLNDIRTDNRIDNLEWGDAKSNAKDRRTNGHQIYGERVFNAKLTIEKARAIREKRSSYSLNSLAKMFRVSKKLILLVVQNKIWKEVNYVSI